MITAKTEPHPRDSSGKPVQDKRDPNKKPIRQSAYPQDSKARGKLQGGEYGDGKGVRTESAKTASGAPITIVTKDQVQLPFLHQGHYTGQKITEADYQKAAKSIGCEVAVIKAVAEVETKSKPFNNKNWPVILFERHYFSGFTDGNYDSKNPDISSPKCYINGTLKQGGKAIDDGQHFGLYSWQYKKLSKAYALNREAALKSCSWGKFQIMGANYKESGYSTIYAFVEAMCQSERKHLNAFVNFVNSNPKLKDAAVKKNWATFALHYNGKSYKKKKYDIQMKEAYKRHAK